MTQQALPPGAPAPRASISYPSQHRTSSIGGENRVGIPRPWLTRARIGDALVRAARRIGRPLEFDQLVAAATLAHLVSRAVLDDVLVELAAAGRLLVEDRPHPRAPLLARVRYYSAPAGRGGVSP
jgi:hypothetical protein